MWGLLRRLPLGSDRGPRRSTDACRVLCAAERKAVSAGHAVNNKGSFDCVRQTPHFAQDDSLDVAIESGRDQFLGIRFRASSMTIRPA
jgi:hypothetical protein